MSPHAMVPLPRRSPWSYRGRLRRRTTRPLPSDGERRLVARPSGISESRGVTPTMLALLMALDVSSDQRSGGEVAARGLDRELVGTDGPRRAGLAAIECPDLEELHLPVDLGRPREGGVRAVDGRAVDRDGLDVHVERMIVVHEVSFPRTALHAEPERRLTADARAAGSASDHHRRTAVAKKSSCVASSTRNAAAASHLAGNFPGGGQGMRTDQQPA